MIGFKVIDNKTQSVAIEITHETGILINSFDDTTEAIFNLLHSFEKMSVVLRRNEEYEILANYTGNLLLIQRSLENIQRVGDAISEAYVEISKSKN